MYVPQCFDVGWYVSSLVYCIRKGLFRPDLRGERIVKLSRRSARCCQKTQSKHDSLFLQEVVFAH